MTNAAVAHAFKSFFSVFMALPKPCSPYTLAWPTRKKGHQTPIYSPDFDSSKHLFSKYNKHKRGP